MIKPEAAAKQLEKWIVQEDEDTPLAQLMPKLKKLPKKLRDICFGIHRCNQDGEVDWEDETDKFADKQTGAFKKLSKADRRKILDLHFGSLASDVETAIAWLAKPEQSHGFTAPAFRGQATPEAIVNRQATLVVSLLELAKYDPKILSIDWLAAWAPHISAWGHLDDELGQLFAAIIDKGGKAGQEVFDILCQSARKEHEIGGMGAHVSNALLYSSRKEGWELMEKMLLAAQRQEGLRQVILNSAQFAHPTAFRRIVRIILDNDLTRFSSVIREFDSWFGTAWAAKASQKVKDTFASLLEFLEKPAAANRAIAGDDPELAYFALWSIAFSDAPKSLKAAQKLLSHSEVEFRYVATLHLTCLDLPQVDALRIKMAADEDLRVALTAVQFSVLNRYYDETEDDAPSSRSPAVEAKWFARIESLLERMPAKPTTLKPLVWPWAEVECDRKQVAWQLVEHLGKKSPLLLIPHLKAFDKYGRLHIVQRIVGQRKWNRETRELVFDFAGDATSDVREAALRAIKKHKISPAEAERLEGYLTRTATDLRRNVVEILLSLDDDDALESSQRLLSRTKNQRLAGLELLRQLAEADRLRANCIAVAEAFQKSQRKVLKDEMIQIDAILDSNREAVSLDNCLGLMDLSNRSPVVPPKKHKVQAVTAATPKLVKALDDWVHANRKTEVRYKHYGEEAKSLLGDIDYGFPLPLWTKPIESELSKLPLREELQSWYEGLPAALKDKDGMGLVRAYIWCQLSSDWSAEEFIKWGKVPHKKPVLDFVLGKAKSVKLRYDFVDDLLCWLMRMNLPKNAISYCYDVAETTYALIPREELESLIPTEDDDDDNYWEQWRNIDGVNEWRNIARNFCMSPDVKVEKKTLARKWRLLHWLDEPIPGAERDRPDLAELADAYLAKNANLADVYDQIIGPRSGDGWRGGFGALSQLTQRVLPKSWRPFITNKPVANAIEKITSKVLEIELARGEAATVSTSAALAVSAFRGMDVLATLLIALGKNGFKKHSGWRTNVGDNRQTTFTELVSNTYPADTDTPAAFAKLMKQAIKDGHFPEERLLQLSFLAPQWTEHIEHAVGWDGFTEGLYWFMAHMKYVWGMEEAFASDEDLDDDDDDEGDDDEDRPEKLSRWEQIIRERTPLSEMDRSDGAIDVAWFQRTHQQLTPKRWEALADAAKYAATSAQAKRAQFVADVLLGKATKKELVDGIKKRNLKENVRLLGLLPLATPAAKREADVNDRYETLQGYLKYANNLSSMSKPEALRAYEIGAQNLASTAGYADPMRLQWAMEAASTKDIAKGPIVVKKGDVSLTLSLDEHAMPNMVIRRGDKQLKSLPKAVSKDKQFVELRDRSKHLKKQASRVKQSLEVAMCRGDSFTGAELMQLSDHAILWPQLERVVLVGEGILGYPDKRGKALRDHAGKLEPVKKGEQLRIAHPYDLLKSKQWSKWQRECFAAERLQPFKQVFRELYVVTSQEKKDKTFSNRYAGQQVNPRQARALWGRRGWSVDEDENVWKAFHAQEIAVSVEFDYGYTTPLEVEGLTIDQIQFRKRDDHKPMKLTDVPPRLFSEVMRDMDLVVSVAHVGDVDPEASASTIEIRTSLLDETCKLLNIKNVKLKANRAVIKGSLGDYTVHLGSGVVHRMPGGSVCLVPVHSQHRGRLFLPFADDDPRTAEVLAKTLMLARDDEIDDPIVLQQIRAMG